MEWKLKEICKETDHRFLNFYTLHYEVGEEKKPYAYFLASRRELDHLLVSTGDIHRADGVLVVALKEEPEPSVLVVEVFRPAMGRKVLEFPAGISDPLDQSPFDTARRETKEETGFTLLDPVLLCPPSPTSSGLSDELVAIVMGKVVEAGESALEPFEDISSYFLPIKDIPAFLNDPECLMALNTRLVFHLLVEKYQK